MTNSSVQLITASFPVTYEGFGVFMEKGDSKWLPMVTIEFYLIQCNLETVRVLPVGEVPSPRGSLIYMT